eukprot:TRINITY_DN31288_c0_g1_i1.p4 TRINITY_DN31288_c0_g1~~TRINITY_DN31288_c0_g1_i1.p4  ORF type:complete len:126 (-),score=13.47 TRINITY_DN31288_c0_g1_i1:558-935(-)
MGDINEKNSTLVTASYDKTVKIWDIDDSDEMTASVSLISTLYPPFGNDKEGQILSISVNNYNGDIACGMQESPWNPGGTVYIFDCETKEIKKNFKNSPHCTPFAVLKKWRLPDIVFELGTRNTIV